MQLRGLRKEVQEYAGLCERLLSSGLSLKNVPFTEAERQMLRYYTDELRQFLDREPVSTNPQF